jgi:GH24 family phage-related lysozyme (muramidase)
LAVWTICDGIVKGVKKGDKATDAECDAMFVEEILTHERRMLACAADLLIVPDKTYVAINDWAFNVGTGAACSSTLIRKLKARDYRGTCIRNDLCHRATLMSEVVSLDVRDITPRSLLAHPDNPEALRDGIV